MNYCRKQSRISGDLWDDCAGNAIMEFLLAAPFLVAVIIGIVDLGRALNQYFTLNKLTYEAVRFAATDPAIQPGKFGPDPVSATSSGQQNVAFRITPLLNHENIPTNRTYLTTELFDASTHPYPDAALQPSQERVVQVTVETPFQAFFPAFSFINLRSTATAPYLPRP